MCIRHTPWLTGRLAACGDERFGPGMEGLGWIAGRPIPWFRTCNCPRSGSRGAAVLFPGRMRAGPCWGVLLTRFPRMQLKIRPLDWLLVALPVVGQEKVSGPVLTPFCSPFCSRRRLRRRASLAVLREQVDVREVFQLLQRLADLEDRVDSEFCILGVRIHAGVEQQRPV